MTEVINTLQTPEQVAEQIKAEIKSTPAEQLEESTKLLTEAQKRGNHRPVETSSGERKTVDQLIEEVKEITTQLRLSSIENEREMEAARAQSATPYYTPDGERKWHSGAPETPLLDVDKLSKLHGVKGYKELSAEQRALGLSVRPSDVKELPVREYFGAGSSGKKANDLARKNPTLYKLLRQRAVDDGLIA